MADESRLDMTTEDVPTEPVDFGVEDGERFLAVPWITGTKFLKYSRMMKNGGLDAVLLVDDFFRDVMEPAEHERFWKYADDPANKVTNQTLGDWFLKLFSYYSSLNSADRPTQPSRPSSSGREQTPDTSTESSSSEESTPPA